MESTTPPPVPAPRQRWKLWLNIITIVALVLLVVFIRKDLASTLQNLHHVNFWFILLLIPIEFVNYHAQTRLYQRMFATVGDRLDYWKLFGISLELNFVNHVFPSGGISGISFFGLRFREEGLRASKTTLVQTMKLVLTFLSFEVLLILGMMILSAANRSNDFTVLVGTMMSTLVVVGTFIFLYVIRSRERINTFFTWVTRVLNRLIHLVRPHHPETINIERARATFADFHDNYQLLSARRRDIRAPFAYALLANVTEVMAVYVVYVAFGRWVNLGAIILAYGIANFAGLVSVLPGGVGVYEALMTAVLVSTGIPAALSIPVTIMYRVVNTLIQVPAGFVLYQRHLGRTRRLVSETHELPPIGGE